ncbi:phage tail tape measure protein [Streptomonospora arabica]|uniref:Phage tail tape measure protein n=1 Tax=Streptomonospora arabica TaxID=412417 RepID=A0ABV9SSN6_9ACTN
MTSLGFNIFAKWSGKGVRDAVKDVDGMSGRLQSAGSAMRGVGETMTASVTAPLAAVGGLVIKTAGDFEQSMQRVAAVSGATGGEMSKLTELAKDLGATTQFSASEAADGMQFLAMAGFDARETMQALPGVLDLAAAGAVELGVAADVASNILSGYGMEAKDIGGVNDVLAKTFTSTNTTLEMLGESMKYVGPVAASAGLSFEEISAAIGLLGNAGIQGSEAGTALRGSIARLLSPTAAVSSKLSELGVTVTDAKGNLLPLVNIIGQLEDSGADTADIMTIFGQEAGPAMAALIGQGSGALKGLTGELKNAGGTAESIAKTQMEGFNGSVKELQSAAEGLAIAVAESGLLSWMTTAAEAVTGWVQALGKSNPMILKVGTVIALLVAVLGPVLIFVGALVASIGAIAAVMTPVIGIVIGVVAGIIALGAALVVAWKRSDVFRNVVMGAWSGIKAGWDALWNGALKPGLMALLGWWRSVWPQIKGTAIEVWGAIVDWAMEIWPKLKAIFDRIAMMVMATFADLKAFWNTWGGVITGIFVAIGAVVGGILLGAFQIIVSVVKGLWQALSGIISGILDVIIGILDVFIGLFTGDWQRMWDGVKRIFSGIWTAIVGVFKGVVTILDGVVQGVITAITKPFIWLWNWMVGNSLIPDLVNAVVSWFRKLRAWAGKIWDTIRAWIVARVMLLYRRVLFFVLRLRLQAIGTFMKLRARAVAIFTAIRDWIIARVLYLHRRVVATVLTLRNTVIARFLYLRNKARAIWDTVRDWIVSRARALRDRVVDAVRALRNRVIDSFQAAKDGVKRAWNKLRDVASAPVKFVVNTVYNDGLRKLWNKVAEKVPGISSIGKVRLPRGFSGGGVLGGYQRAKRDDVMTPMRRGEGVLVPEVVRGLGPGFVHALNHAGNTGGVSAVRKLSEETNQMGLGQAPMHHTGRYASKAGFAKGGITGWLSDKWSDVVGKVKSWATKPLNSLRDRLADKFGRGDNFEGIPFHVFQMIRKKVIDRFKKADDDYAASMVGGADSWVGLASASERLRRAARFARAQHGEPYVWGGAGPHGFDCSGFTGSIENSIRGVGPYFRRYSTHSFVGSGPAGWKRNLRSPYMVGITNAGVGHTAGTLMGVNVESSGSAGVRVGGGARGAGDPMFTSRWGFAPVAGDQAASGKATGGLVFDRGGYAPAGKSIIDNRTGRPEPLRRGEERPSRNYYITVKAGPASDPAAIGKAAVEAIQQYERRSGKRWRE